MEEQEFTATGTPPFEVGQSLKGFNFWLGKECQGKIREIKPYILFGYVLDTGEELGPHDDIYTRSKNK